jgi:FtsP/CotA-like multicopper oxidase with cupredoxin domain
MAVRRISRRDLLQLAGVGGVSLFIKGCLPQFPTISREVTPDLSGESAVDLEISLTAMPEQIKIFPGKETTVWRYSGEVISGPKSSIEELQGSYLGPTIHVNKGDRIRVHFKNELPEPSIIHWHGLHVPTSADGHPRFVIDQGESYVYDFTVSDRAGTYWYHPHPHGRTGPQVYAGLAGLFIIHDPGEEQLNLPKGEYDIPLVIQDRDFNTDNQLVYGTGHMMDRMVGFLGSQILINGLPDFQMVVSRRPYRLRILNGSNSRIYKLAWNDQRPIKVLATDGGLLELPEDLDYIVLSPAQRVDIWVDFSQNLPGEEIELISLPFKSYGGESSFSVLKVIIQDEQSAGSGPPGKLSDLVLHDQNNAVNRISPRKFSLSFGPGMVWTLNGRTFDMEDVSREEIVKLGDLEIWEFENRLGSGMGMMGSMQLPHPMHIHGLQFQVIERTISPEAADRWSSLREGIFDQGWHDTVLVFPGEKVKILLKFEDFEGLYLYHCHNLEHEDMGMMRNFLIQA